MERETVAKILELCRLDYLHILPHQTGYRNHVYPVELKSGGLINLIIYKNEPDILAKIRAANSVGDFLASQGYPARTTFDKRVIKLKSATSTRYAALYNYLPGQTIPWEAHTMEHLKNLGGIMGQMHALLAGYIGDLPKAADELQSLAARMQKYFDQDGVKLALNQKLKLTVHDLNFGQLLKDCGVLPGQQALHLDFVRGNILFECKEISGVLDFEKAAHGHPVIDVARTLAFLLVDCKYKPEHKIRKYFLESGYNKRGPAKLTAGQAILEPLINLFLTHDLYKFLRHNPYESLPQNEHFARTKSLLVKRGLITTSE